MSPETPGYYSGLAGASNFVEVSAPSGSSVPEAARAAARVSVANVDMTDRTEPKLRLGESLTLEIQIGLVASNVAMAEQLSRIADALAVSPAVSS